MFAVPGVLRLGGRLAQPRSRKWALKPTCGLQRRVSVKPEPASRGRSPSAYRPPVLLCPKELQPTVFPGPRRIFRWVSE